LAVRTTVGTRRYIATRIVQSLIIWFLIVTLNFIIFRIMPGDPRASLVEEGMPPEIRIAIVERFGLDRTLLEQYALYWTALLQGDMGFSFSHFGEPVWQTIFGFRFTNTFILMGASMVSDAFFPFRDGVDVGIKEGVTAVVQPGGSMRDFEVIEACNEAKPQVTMVFTGQRAFKH